MKLRKKNEKETWKRGVMKQRKFNKREFLNNNR